MDRSQSKTRSLPAGTRLDEYTIVRVLSTGGFSEVYLALDGHDRKVAIKEYLPRELSRRGEDYSVTVPDELDRDVFRFGLKCFFEEARVLAGVRHPNVVRVSNCFRANQTVYMVMEYADGRSLAQEIELAGQLPEAQLRSLFALLVDGLAAVHAHHLLHLDIKPGNIYLRRNGSPMLLDFGAARQTMQRQQRAANLFTPGYAAPEQYDLQAVLGPWTDIYALGACMYVAMGGGRLPSADQRLRQETLKPATVALASQYSAPLLALVDQCLALDPAVRPRDLAGMRQTLAATDYVAPRIPTRWWQPWWRRKK